MSARRPLDVLAVGEALVVLTGEHVGLLGEETRLGIGTGGAELNVAIALSRLGVRAGWAGALSSDELGRHVRRRLRAEDLDTSMVSAEPGPTGLMFKQSRTVDQVTIDYRRRDSAGSRWSAAPIIEASFGGAAWVHTSGVTPALGPRSAAETKRLLEAAVEAGAKVSFDVNFRAKLWSEADAAPILRELVALADLVFADEREAALVGLGESDDTAGGPAGEVVLRSASRVVSLSAGEGTHELRWDPGPGIDPIGAGDAFAAGYLYARLAGDPPPQRLATACALGRWAAQTAGDHVNLPHLGEFESAREVREDR